MEMNIIHNGTTDEHRLTQIVRISVYHLPEQMTSRKFLHEEITSAILDSVFAVPNTLGCRLVEKVYENTISWDLKLRNRKVEL